MKSSVNPTVSKHIRVYNRVFNIYIYNIYIYNIYIYIR